MIILHTYKDTIDEKTVLLERIHMELEDFRTVGGRERAQLDDLTKTHSILIEKLIHCERSRDAYRELSERLTGRMKGFTDLDEKSVCFTSTSTPGRDCLEETPLPHTTPAGKISSTTLLK
jgi:hypothetical protein